MLDAIYMLIIVLIIVTFFVLFFLHMRELYMKRNDEITSQIENVSLTVKDGITNMECPTCPQAVCPEPKCECPRCPDVAVDVKELVEEGVAEKTKTKKPKKDSSGLMIDRLDEFPASEDFCPIDSGPMESDGQTGANTSEVVSAKDSMPPMAKPKAGKGMMMPKEPGMVKPKAGKGMMMPKEPGMAKPKAGKGMMPKAGKGMMPKAGKGMMMPKEAGMAKPKAGKGMMMPKEAGTAKPKAGKGMMMPKEAGTAKPKGTGVVDEIEDTPMDDVVEGFSLGNIYYRMLG